MALNVPRGLATLENAIRRDAENGLAGVQLGLAAAQSGSPESVRLTEIEAALHGVLNALGPSNEYAAGR